MTCGFSFSLLNSPINILAWSWIILVSRWVYAVLTLKNSFLLSSESMHEACDLLFWVCFCDGMYACFQVVVLS